MEWKRVVVNEYVPTYRDGWIGVWDAFKSAITHNPRLTVTKPLEFSVWIKTEHEYKAEITYGQVVC